MKRKLVLVGLVFLMILMIPIGVKGQDIEIYTNVQEGNTYSGTFNIAITTYCPEGTDLISLFIDWDVVAQAEQRQYLDYEWDTTLYSDGTYNVLIQVHDNMYTMAYVEYYVIVDNTPETTTTIEATSETTTEETTDTIIEDSITTSIWIESDKINLSSFVIFGIMGIIGVLVIGVVVSKRGKKTEIGSGVNGKILVICPYCGSKTEQGITKCQKCGADL